MYNGVTMNASEGTSSIADANGNLLFYSDGINVWNKNHLIMPNGIGLLSNSSSTQAALIIRQPGSNSLYYLFTTDAFEGAFGLHYNVVDMSLNSGLGDVSLLNGPLNAPCDEKICAVPHANGNDVWLINTAHYGDTIYTYKITSTGLNTTPVISPTGIVHTTNVNFGGQVKASPLGNRLAAALPDVGFELYDFDNAIGIATNPLSINNYPNAYGVEFSPDGSRLYGNPYSNGDLWQFDLNAGSTAAIIASATLVSTNQVGRGSLQLAPDNKIYVAESGSSSIGVINQPNALGVACNFQTAAVPIPGFCNWGLPNMQVQLINQMPVALFNAPNHICPGTCTNFNNVSLNGTSFQWTFAGATPAFSTDVNPVNICYNTPGNYGVTLIATNATGSDTLQLNNFITVYPFPLPQGISQSGDTLVANTGAVSYQWFQDGSIIQGATDYYYIATSGGNFNVVATDANGCEVEAAIFDVIAAAEFHVDVKNEFRIYPNPVSEKLHIVAAQNFNDVLLIYNSTGEKVDVDITPVTASEKKLDVSALTDGLYYLRFSTKSSDSNNTGIRFIKSSNQ